MINQNMSAEIKELIIHEDTKIINPSKSLKNKLFRRKKEVTVVIAAYNAQDTIKKCINSIIRQSMPFEKIELIVVDDCSTDDTPHILKEYARKYANITVVLLGENTGAASMPRNIGIELSTTEKIMFLDSDDWLAEDGIQALVDTMNRRDDDVVIGKTIKVEDKGETIHAEFISYTERESLSPFEYPYLFYYLGPQSKIFKTSVLKENSIYFPGMRFGEDKLFLINVYMKCSKISGITRPVCYLNRLSSNNQSITKTVDFLGKRKSDLVLLKHVLQQNLDDNEESILVKRIFEYDLIKSCDSMIFLKSKEIHESVFELILEAYQLIKDRPYDIMRIFDNPLYKFAAQLIVQENYEDFIKFFQWWKLEKYKKIIIKNAIAYYYIDFLSDNEKHFIPINLYVRAYDSYVENGEYVQLVEIYGEKRGTIDCVLIRDRHHIENEIKVPITINNHIGEFRISYEKLNELNSSLFTVFIRYDGYRLANVKRMTDTNVTYEGRTFNFYTTKAGNLGFSLK